MSRTYGKKARRSLTAGNDRTPSSLKTPIQLSPEKFESLKGNDITNTLKVDDHGGDEDRKLISPFNSPRRSSRIKLLSSENSPTMNKVNRDDFELEESIIKPSYTSRKRTLKPEDPSSLKKKVKEHEETTPQSKSYFVEAKEKPCWSPHFSPSNAQKGLFEREPLSLSRKKLSFVDEAITSGCKNESLNDEVDLKDHVKDQNNSKSGDAGERPEHDSQTRKDRSIKRTAHKPKDLQEWDLFKDIIQSTPKSKPKLLTKEHLQSPSRRKQNSSEEHDLIKFFNSQFVESQDLEDTPEPEQPSTKDTLNSPVKRSRKIYGERRSYLVESTENGAKDTQEQEPLDITQVESEQESEVATTQDLKTVTQLRAQGENAQFLDELNFLMEGIESGNTIAGLLGLALRLFEEDFLSFVKSQSLAMLNKLIDSNDPVQRYLWAFIIVKTMDGTSDTLSFDTHSLEIIDTLIGDPEVNEIKRASKATKSLFKEFQSKFEKSYPPLFFALTLLLQNPKIVDKNISKNLISALTCIENTSDLDHKNFQMILILLEAYLSKQEQVGPEFKQVLPIAMNHKYKDEKTIILALKVLILLTVREFQELNHQKLLQKAINESKMTNNDDVLLLYMGLIINLIEDPTCMDKITQRGNLSAIYSLYSKAGSASIGYLALLVGTLYKNKANSIERMFHINELRTLKLELQKFDSKGNENMRLQVEDILTHFI